MLTFVFSTAAFGWFEVALALVVIKVLLRVGLVLLGKYRANPFDIRILPEFLTDDIFLQVGGLALLLLTTFLVLPADAPETLLALWTGVQGFYYIAAVALCGKLVAEIKDVFPLPSKADPDEDDDMSDVTPEDRAIADSAEDELERARAAATDQ